MLTTTMITHSEGAEIIKVNLGLTRLWKASSGEERRNKMKNARARARSKHNIEGMNNRGERYY